MRHLACIDYGIELVFTIFPVASSMRHGKFPTPRSVIQVFVSLALVILNLYRQVKKSSTILEKRSLVRYVELNDKVFHCFNILVLTFSIILASSLL